MITLIPQEEILTNWPIISAAFEKYWDTTINYETLPNLKRKLLADFNSLWLWTSDEWNAKYLFVTHVNDTATAKILTVTHTAGFNDSGKRWSRKQLEGIIKDIFEEVEDLARTLYLDAVCIHARPAHVKLADGYEEMARPIVKQLT